MKFVVKMDLDGLREYLQSRLSDVKNRLESTRIDNKNAAYHWRTGEHQALKDLLTLIDLFGDSFFDKVPAVRQRRMSIKCPEYDEAIDLQNDDAHWVYGYDKVMNSISMVEEEEGEAGE